MRTRFPAFACLAALFAVGCDNDANVETRTAPASAATVVDAQETARPNATPTVPGTSKVTFSLADMAGQPRDAKEWDGQPKLLNFWATWCAPCRREIPLLKQTQDTYTDLDLQVIGIAVDFLEDVVAYAEEANFNYPILVGQEDAMAVAETSGVEFIGLPFTMVVAPGGELLKTHVGEIVEAHIVEITDVLEKLDDGELDVAGARVALRGL